MKVFGGQWTCQGAIYAVMALLLDDKMIRKKMKKEDTRWWRQKGGRSIAR